MAKIEFFHDVICSFCFPLSYRMRKLQRALPDLEIVHRSFALVRHPEDFDRMFGSRALAKPDILHHWEQANQNDDLHRFNIEGMRNTDFLFPSSMPALMACKAASFIGGNVAYWDVFDALQHALFVQSRNIELLEVIMATVQQLPIDMGQWQYYFTDPQTAKAVEDDLLLARQYGIHGVPCLVVNGKTKISGAQPLTRLQQILEQEISACAQDAAGVCRIDGGELMVLVKW